MHAPKICADYGQPPARVGVGSVNVWLLVGRENGFGASPLSHVSHIRVKAVSSSRTARSRSNSAELDRARASFRRMLGEKISLAHQSVWPDVRTLRSRR